MLRGMTVEIVKDNGEQIFENVTRVVQEDEYIVIEKYDDEIRINGDCYMSEVYKSQISVAVDDWVKYIDPNKECIDKGQVTEINNNEIIVKTVPDGFQVAIHKNQIFKIIDNS